MAVNKIARKSSKFRVVFTVPDFCWPPPPAPPSVPPIPFPLFADLGGAKTVAKDVRLNRKPAFVFKASKTDKTYGDEIALPGRKGVKSRTATSGKRVASSSEPSSATTKGAKRSAIEPSSEAMT